MEAGKIGQIFENGGHLTGEGVSLYVDALKMGRIGDLPPTVLEHVQDASSAKKRSRASMHCFHGKTTQQLEGTPISTERPSQRNGPGSAY